MRTINQEQFANGTYKTLANEMHSLVDTVVAADPNFLSTYANFQVSLTTDTPGDNNAGTSPGIFKLMDSRASYLNNVLSAAPPVLSSPSVANGDQFGSIATLSVAAANAVNVYAGYRYRLSDPFTRVPMYDDGLHGDGQAGDLIYGVECPVLSLLVQYYFYAENSNTGAFLPQRAEHEFFSFAPDIALAAPGEVVINELASNNDSGIENENGKFRDWFELYNLSDKALGLRHLFISNKPGGLGQWQFPQEAFIAPHQHLLIWADDLDHTLVDGHTNFNLSKTSDELFLSDTIAIYDSISYSNQAANHSLSRCPDGIGAFQDSAMPTPRSANNCSTASKEAALVPGIKIVPNPASDVIYFETESSVSTISIYTNDGRLLMQSNEKFANVKDWKPGIYWARVLFGNGKWVMMPLVKN
jgi:hypothetical protein